MLLASNLLTRPAHSYIFQALTATKAALTWCRSGMRGRLRVDARDVNRGKPGYLRHVAVPPVMAGTWLLRPGWTDYRWQRFGRRLGRRGRRGRERRRRCGRPGGCG